jgi:hypothetical protein
MVIITVTPTAMMKACPILSVASVVRDYTAACS